MIRAAKTLFSTASLYVFVSTFFVVFSAGVTTLHFVFPEALASSEKESEFADFTLPVPQMPGEKSYLGLSGNKDFKVSEINAQVLIIEIFSKVCPHCHKEAPKMNKLHQTIMQRSELKDRIKIIGIAAGNTDTEVMEYKKEYDVSFPLFSDKYLSVVGPMGVMSTPTFIGVKINSDRTLEELYSKKGSFGEVPEFLNHIVTTSGLSLEE